jgi:hypothetical protein
MGTATLDLATDKSVGGSADLSALQVIFPFESGSDLLDHFATIGIV